MLHKIGKQNSFESLNDVTAVLAARCKILPKGGQTPMDAFHFAIIKINKIRKHYLRGKDFWSDNIKVFIQGQNVAIYTISLLICINSLCFLSEGIFPDAEVQE